MNERTEHSKLALAAAILPLTVWLYIAIVFGLFYASGKLGISFFSGYEGAWAIGIAFYFFLLVVIPFGGHLAGFICGTIGLFSKDNKRIFAVIGLILCVLPFAVGWILYKSGYSYGT